MNEFQTLFDVIGVLAHRRYVTMERSLSPLGFNHTEARLLTILSQQGEIAQEEVSGLLVVDRSNAGRSLKRLEQDGYITRKKGKADRRKFLVRITEKGQIASSRIKEVAKSVAESFFREMKRKDAEKITMLLKEHLTKDEYEMRSNAPGTNFRSRAADSSSAS